MQQKDSFYSYILLVMAEILPHSLILGSWPQSPVHSFAFPLALIRQFFKSVQFINLAGKRVFFFLINLFSGSWHMTWAHRGIHRTQEFVKGKKYVHWQLLIGSMKKRLKKQGKKIVISLSFRVCELLDQVILRHHSLRLMNANIKVEQNL